MQEIYLVSLVTLKFIIPSLKSISLHSKIGIVVSEKFKGISPTNWLILISKKVAISNNVCNLGFDDIPVIIAKAS